MISVHENVSAHTNRRLSETLDSKTALFSSTNFGEVYLFKIYIVLSFYLSSFNFRHRNHYRICMENVTDCKLGFSQTEDMKFKCILNISPNHNLSTDFYKFLNSIYRYTTIPISVFVGYLEGYSFSHSCRINSPACVTV